MTALLLAAYSLVGGTVKDVPGANFYVPDEFCDSAADESHTPGSDDWYVEVSSISVPAEWQVWTNGYICTNDDWKPQVEHRRDFGDLDLALTFCGHAPDLPLRENQFDVAWRTNDVSYYAIARGRDELSCQGLYGHNLYRMRAHKADKEMRTGLYSSFCAYWERLRKGAESNYGYDWDWGVDDWGSTDPDDPSFRYDTSNYEGTIDNIMTWSLKSSAPPHLYEHADVTNLIGHMSAIRSSGLTRIARYDDAMGLHMHNRAFLFRPTWLFGGYDSYESEYLNPALVGWSTTVLPPLVEQGVTNATYTPEPIDFVLIPKFDWREGSIASYDDGEWIPSQKWECSALTLDGIWNDGIHPIRHLYESLGHDTSAGPLVLIRNYRMADPFHDFMSNTFSRCMRSLPSPVKCVQAYSNQSWGPLSCSRKMTPGQLVGVNQMLGVMNRIIDIPMSCILSDGYHSTYWTSASYSPTEPVSIPFEFDRMTGELHVTGEELEYRIERSDEDGDSSHSYVNRHDLYLRIGPVLDKVGRDTPISGSASSLAYISTDFQRRMVEYAAGRSVIITSVSPVQGDIWTGGFRIFWMDSDGNEYSDHFGVDFTFGEISINSGIPVERTWETDETGYAIEEVRAYAYDYDAFGYLAKREREDEGMRKVEFKADADHIDFHDVTSDLVDEQHDDGQAARPGYDTADPDTGLGKIPEVNSLVTVPGGAFTPSGEVIFSLEYPNEHTIETDYFTAIATNETDQTFCKTNTIAIATNSTYACKAFATIVSNVTEEGWAIVEALTNVTERTLVSSSFNSNTNEGEAVKFHASSNEMVAVFTYWELELDVFDYSVDITSNTLSIVTETNTTSEAYDLVTTNIVVYYTNHVAQAAVTNVVRSQFSNVSTNVVTDHEETSDSYQNHIVLTGYDIVDSWDYSYETIEEKVDLVDEFVTGGVHLQYFFNPHTGRKTYLPNAPAETYLGRVGVLVTADTNMPPVRIDFPNSMTDEYESIITYKFIISKDLELESMKLIEKEQP